jgi:osmotically-inducible protein OsmY
MKRAVLYTCFALALSACTRDEPVSSTTTTSATLEPGGEAAKRDSVASFLDDNPMLTRRVEAVLSSEPSLSLASSNVNVSARGDIVTLSGTVSDYATLDTIEETVRRMPGVARVYNDVQVNPLMSQARADENIAFSLQRSLVDQPKVSIEVVRGVVMLRGEPSLSPEQVQRIAERTPGVRAVVNHLSEPAEDSTLVQ